jgi:hypothetical protein
MPIAEEMEIHEHVFIGTVHSHHSSHDAMMPFSGLRHPSTRMSQAAISHSQFVLSLLPVGDHIHAILGRCH